MTEINFNNLPQAVQELNRKMDLLLSLQEKHPNEEDKLLTIEELIKFLPEHPARQTIYQWGSNRTVPFEKHGKKLYFRQSAIEKWLSNGRRIL